MVWHQIMSKFIFQAKDTCTNTEVYELTLYYLDITTYILDLLQNYANYYFYHSSGTIRPLNLFFSFFFRPLNLLNCLPFMTFVFFLFCILVLRRFYSTKIYSIHFVQSIVIYKYPYTYPFHCFSFLPVFFSKINL